MIIQLNSTWFISIHLGSSLLNISTRPGQSQLNIPTQHSNSTWRRNDQPPGSTVQPEERGSAQRYSSAHQLKGIAGGFNTHHKPQHTNHIPHTTNHKPQHTHTTHHTSQATSHKQPTSSFSPVTITHMTAERRGQIPTGGFSGSGTSPGSRGGETDCDVRGGCNRTKLEHKRASAHSRVAAQAGTTKDRCGNQALGSAGATGVSSLERKRKPE